MTTSFSLTYEQITACAERQMSLYSERAAVLNRPRHRLEQGDGIGIERKQRWVSKRISRPRTFPRKA
jgi:hypothetical protein